MSSICVLTINGKPVKGVIEGNYKSIVEIASAVTAQAKDLAPVDEGRLRNSIMWKTQKDKGGFNDSPDQQAEKEINVYPKANEGYVGSNLDYALYQEFGTRKMAPQPYLRPAILLMQGSPAREIIKRIEAEKMRGVLKEGQKRETFII
jgi:HK97 gp10 family phage protein